MNDNLPELRDIHLPDGVSIFPIAYGWYVIILAIVLLYLFIRAYRVWRLTSRKLYAFRLLDELNRADIIASAAAVSEILRRICVYRYPEAVSLKGDGWLDFIQNHCSKKMAASEASLLQNAPYLNPRNHTYQPADLQNLTEYARLWIGENL